MYLQEAKEAGALKEAKNKLEKEVEELTSQLQLEKCMRVSIMVNKQLPLTMVYRDFSTMLQR